MRKGEEGWKEEDELTEGAKAEPKPKIGALKPAKGAKAGTEPEAGPLKLAAVAAIRR